MLQDLATIFLIRDNMGKRPIYFSWSDGGYPDQTLGLSPYLVSQGFVRKLMPKPVVPNDSIVLSPSLGFSTCRAPRSCCGTCTTGKPPRATGPAAGWTALGLDSSALCGGVRRGGESRCDRGADALAARGRFSGPGGAAEPRPQVSRLRGSMSPAAARGRCPSPAAPPFQDSQVSGHPSPNGGSGWPGRPIRSCSISCRTTISSIGPVTRKEDVVIGAPVPGALAAGALEAVAFHHVPDEPVELPGKAGTGFGPRRTTPGTPAAPPSADPPRREVAAAHGAWQRFRERTEQHTVDVIRFLL